MLVALLAAMAIPLQAATLYRVDQRNGTVGFSVGVLGLFNVRGRFAHFGGDLLLDLQQPDHSRIEVTIETVSVEMPLQDQVELLRSEAYFDTTRHPAARFSSSGIEVLSAAHYRIHGTLQLRGITRLQDLDAVLVDRHADAGRHAEVADFVITGQLSRAAFGMVADRPMLSDTVQLDIRVRLVVGLAVDTR